MSSETPAGAVRRRSITSEAASLFERDGYHEASMRDLADVVGISKPTLYHYFRSKDEILHAIQEELIDELLERFDARRDDDLTSSEELREVISDILDLIDTCPGHVRTFHEHYRQLTPEGRRDLDPKRDRYARALEDIIDVGVAKGEFATSDPRLAALAVFGMANWAYHWYRPGGPFEPRQIATFLWEFLLQGLAAPGRDHGLESTKLP